MKAKAIQSKAELRVLDTLQITSDDGQSVTFYGVAATLRDPGTSRRVANNVNWKLDAANGTRTQGNNGELGYDDKYPYLNSVWEIPGQFKFVADGAPVLDQNGDTYTLKFNRTP